MIELGSRVLQTRLDVIRLKVGEVREDLLLWDAGRDEVENVFHTNAHPPDAGPASALVRVEGDAFHVIHAGRLGTVPGFRKVAIRPRRRRPGVRGGVDLLQLPDGDVGADLRGLQAGVAELFLPVAIVGAMLQHERGAGVAE